MGDCMTRGTTESTRTTTTIDEKAPRAVAHGRTARLDEAKADESPQRLSLLFDVLQASALVLLLVVVVLIDRSASPPFLACL